MIELYVTRLFIPRFGNDGVPFADELLELTEETLRKKFHGLTIWGEVQGQWIGPSGRLSLDTHRVYEIAHAGRERAWWEEMKEHLRVRFVQEEIWILQSSTGWNVL